jgi:solute:Na+ symporter, SSS family
LQKLVTIDIVVLLVYLAGVVGFGCWFVRRSRNTEGFMAAGRSLPGWVVGLSIFGTYLSSNTFLGVPGKAYGSNWNSFVFSLSLPIAAYLAVRFFVPFYRRTGEISAYHHLEKRFGIWARTYAVICYLLMQLARVGSIMFGVALAMHPLVGWNMAGIIIATGILVTFYTLVGGIEAVIWTDVVQSIVLMVGAIAITLMLLFGMPEGPGQIFSIAAEHHKFSLGSFGASVSQATFWVVLFYGLFMNLNNFGIDQSFIQRYHTAKSDKAAGRSVWLAALMYLPISLVFFFIGSSLFAYYQTPEHADMLSEVKQYVAEEKLAAENGQANGAAYQIRVKEKAATLESEDIGDKVLPHFIVRKLPPGMAGLLIAAIFAAAMSSIDTSLNSSATIILSDIYKRYIRPQAGEKESMRVLYGATLLWGTLGTSVAVAMIGVKSVLDTWWKLSGIFAGGMLGLFLLGLIGRRTRNHEAITAVIIGILVILWMTFSSSWMALPEYLRSPFHDFMITAIGTLTILFVGMLISRIRTVRSS